MEYVHLLDTIRTRRFLRLKQLRSAAYCNTDRYWIIFWWKNDQRIFDYCKKNNNILTSSPLMSVKQSVFGSWRTVVNCAYIHKITFQTCGLSFSGTIPCLQVMNSPYLMHEVLLKACDKHHNGRGLSLSFKSICLADGSEWWWKVFF